MDLLFTDQQPQCTDPWRKKPLQRAVLTCPNCFDMPQWRKVAGDCQSTPYYTPSLLGSACHHRWFPGGKGMPGVCFDKPPPLLMEKGRRGSSKPPLSCLSPPEVCPPWWIVSRREKAWQGAALTSPPPFFQSRKVAGASQPLQPGQHGNERLFHAQRFPLMQKLPDQECFLPLLVQPPPTQQPL